MSTVTWLHLSDLHFRVDETHKHHTWNQNVVLRALLTDLPKQIKEHSLRPDFIAITGDIAFHAAPEEYRLASEFLDELRSVTGLGKDRLFLVPGNHDIAREAVSRGARTIAGSLTSREAVHEVMEHPDDRRLLLGRFGNYAAFVRDYFGAARPFDDEHYFYVAPVVVPGCRVAVLGLNTAWLAVGDKEDRNRLVLGERQVRTALDQAKDADLRIALMHHPFEWLADFDRADNEAILNSNCRFILHGHLHTAGLLDLRSPDEHTMVIAGGAAYEKRNHENRYNLVQVDLDTGAGAVHLRRYSDERGGFWTADTMTYRNAELGRWDFRLPGRGAAAHPVAPVRVAAPAVAPLAAEQAYLRRMLVTRNVLPLGVIDPRAVERARERVMDLVSVYVDLDTTTQVQVKEEKGKGRKGSRGSGDPSDRIEEKTRPLGALEAAAQEPVLVLLGDPGSGKTTFANHLALCLAGARLERLAKTATPTGDWMKHLRPTWTHGDLLPVCVRLRDFAASAHCDGTARGLYAFMEDTLAADNVGEFAPVLRQRLDAGGVLVILDGLDEVAEPGALKQVRDAVASFAGLREGAKAPNRFLITCRVYAYQDAGNRLPDVPYHTLVSFTPKHIERFIESWHREVVRLGWKSEADAQQLKQCLHEAVGRSDLAPLASNPLQLTMMSLLQFSYGRLPEDRVELYNQMVELLLVRWQEARLGAGAGITRQIKLSDFKAAMARVAFQVHQDQGASAGTADISEALLLSVLKDYLDGSYDRARQLVTFIQQRADLLIWRGPELYTFPHRSYQEFLAGTHLAAQGDFPEQLAALVQENYGQWREVALWAVEVAARAGFLFHGMAAVEALCPRDVPGTGEVSEHEWRAASLAGEGLLGIGLQAIQSKAQYRAKTDRVRQWLAQLLERDAMPAAERATGGRVLAKLGDPRFDQERWALPKDEHLGFVRVPAGTFRMGTPPGDIAGLVKRLGGDKGWYQDETPQHPVDVPEFYIGRYPVTSAQFQAFVKAGGYAEKRWWPEAGERWSAAGFKGRWDDTARTGPYESGEPFSLANHPVVGVTWYEALAYCHWLDAQLRGSQETPEPLAGLLRSGTWRVTLPSEAEWEKAARGDTRWQFPWSDDPDPDKANYVETRIGNTSAVGCFPKGRSPYQCEDMAGNVWEWTRSVYVPYPYDPKDTKGRENLAAGDDVARVRRGGAFGNVPGCVRCAIRGGDAPYYRFVGLGFRVVLSPFPDSGH